MRRLALLLVLLFTAMAAAAGNFFPPEYKHFPFKEGDLLVGDLRNGRFSVNKVLRVDRIDVRKGSTINIRGVHYTATDDDFLLIVSMSFGEDEFHSFDEARAAAQARRWHVVMGHVPNRAPGAVVGQTWVGHAAVTEAELAGYRKWRAAFDRDETGVF